MENEYLLALVRVVLQAQILDYFAVVGVELKDEELYISLDERMNEELSSDIHLSQIGQ